MTEQAITFITDDNVELEGRVAYNDKSKKSAIILHPAPGPMGGNMDNFVVDAFQQIMCNILGYTTLRFNMRGTGRSRGVSSTTLDRKLWGSTEGPDVGGAVNYLKSNYPEIKDYVLCAYSMGTGIGCRFLNEHNEIFSKAILVAPIPSPLLSSLEIPLLLVAAENDQLIPLDVLKKVNMSKSSSKLIIAENSDHFNINPLIIRDSVVKWLAGLADDNTNKKNTPGSNL